MNSHQLELTVPDPTGRGRRKIRGWSVAVVLIAALTVLAVANRYYDYPARIGPAQPIAFSHRVHVADKKISCILCHPAAFDTPHAGMPTLETCLLCHRRIIIHHPQIATLRGYSDRGEPVEWVRIASIPDHVHFNHQAHVRKGIDCGRCHGDVAQMDRVVLAQPLTMGFCVRCHRDEDASHDCLICHY